MQTPRFLRRRGLAVAAGVAAGLSGVAGAGAWCVAAGFVGVLAAFLALHDDWRAALSEEALREGLAAGVVSLIIWLAGSIAVKAVAGVAVLIALLVVIYIARTIILGEASTRA